MSALAKTSTANAQATQHRTSPFSTASPSTCSNRTKPANAESTENASRPVGTMTTYFNSSDIKMRLPWENAPDSGSYVHVSCTIEKAEQPRRRGSWDISSQIESCLIRHSLRLREKRG